MISITLKDLKSALAGLSKIVSRRAALDCLRCIRVDATPEKVTLTGTDLDLYAQVILPEARSATSASFLLPLDRLQSLARRLSTRSSLYLEEGKVSWDLDSGRATEAVESPKLKEFPEAPTFHNEPVPLPESFPLRFGEAMRCSSHDDSRYVLKGVALDVRHEKESGHYLVGTDGRHLFSANSFTLPLKETVIIPNHKFFLWRELTGPWALAAQKLEESTRVRIVAGDWTLTFSAVDGNYPNWPQVVPDRRQRRTAVHLPENHQFTKIVNCLPGDELKDKPVDLMVENGTVAVKDTIGGETLPLAGAKATGPDVLVRVNRIYLARAFDYGLTRLDIADGTSALHFTREGRQMVIMPLRVGDPSTDPTNQPAPQEPQPERKPMPATNGHTTGATSSHPNGVSHSTRSETPADKPALEAAIEKFDAFKNSFRETLAGMNELTALLRQAVRDQKSGAKEIQTVRQTLRSLQGVKI